MNNDNSRESPAGYFAGCHKVSLEEVLAFRDERAARQRELLAAHTAAAEAAPLASITLNIPGEYKAFPLALRCFHEELRVFTLALEAENIAVIHQEYVEKNAGYEGFFSIAASPETLKKIAIDIEDSHPLGRLFDIDILTIAGEKISRNAGRPCLVCGGDGFTCARSRAHDLSTLTCAMLDIMERFVRQRLGEIITSAAFKSLIGEVAVTPKPGLVDRVNSGAHRDMDFFTFINSAAAILPFFQECAFAGFDASLKYADIQNDSQNLQTLFNSLRPKGKIAEALMRKSTGGINTHRGVIFSLGVLSAAFGLLYHREENPALDAIFALCSAMTSRLPDDFSHGQINTHGEAIYAQNGLSGIRGEVSQGFPSVRLALPVLHHKLEAGHSLNNAGVATLLSLLAHTADTNIVHRSSAATLTRIQQEVAAFLQGNPDMDAILRKAAELDRDFTSRNISPGGCADLLAVALFCYHLDS
jgi:holo-ACP synthase/triphosphoribosyl-dephospho-CoA synthase